SSRKRTYPQRYVLFRCRFFALQRPGHFSAAPHGVEHRLDLVDGVAAAAHLPGKLLVVDAAAAGRRAVCTGSAARAGRAAARAAAAPAAARAPGRTAPGRTAGGPGAGRGGLLLGLAALEGPLPLRDGQLLAGHLVV